MKIATYLFPSQLSAPVLQSEQCSPPGLCQGCRGVASVPETSVICVLSLNLMVSRKTLPFHVKYYTELSICCFVLLWPSRVAAAVAAWGLHLQALKKPKLLWKQWYWSISLHGGVLPVPHFHCPAVCQEHPSEGSRCGSSFICKWKWASPAVNLFLLLHVMETWELYFWTMNF